MPLLDESFYDPRDARWTFFGVVATILLGIISVVDTTIAIVVSLNNPFGTDLAIILGSLFIVVAGICVVIVSREILKGKKLIFEIHSSVPAVKTHPDISDSLRKRIHVTYGAEQKASEPVTNLYLVVLGIRNIGNKKVFKADFQTDQNGSKKEKDPEFTFGENTRILDDPGNKFKMVEEEKNKLLIDPRDLARKECITFKVLVDQLDGEFKESSVECTNPKFPNLTIEKSGISISKNKKILDICRNVVLIIISLLSLSLCFMVFFAKSYNIIMIIIAFLILFISYYHIMLFMMFNNIIRKYMFSAK